MMAWMLALSPAALVQIRYGTPCRSSQARTKSTSARFELQLVVSNATSRANMVAVVMVSSGVAWGAFLRAIAALYTAAPRPQTHHAMASRAGSPWRLAREGGSGRHDPLAHQPQGAAVINQEVGGMAIGA